MKIQGGRGGATTRLAPDSCDREQVESSHRPSHIETVFQPTSPTARYAASGLVMLTCLTVKASRRGSVLEHHMANGGVVLQPIHGHVLTIPRQFLTAVRHFADEHEVGVHPGAAVLQACGQAVGTSDISGPHRRRQAVVRIVGPAEYLCFITELG